MYTHTQYLCLSLSFVTLRYIWEFQHHLVHFTSLTAPVWGAQVRVWVSEWEILLTFTEYIEPYYKAVFEDDAVGCVQLCVNKMKDIWHEFEGDSTHTHVQKAQTEQRHAQTFNIEAVWREDDVGTSARLECTSISSINEKYLHSDL